MCRRTTVAALVLALLALVSPPAAAKSPIRIEVHDLRTGEKVVVGPDGGTPGDSMAFVELVGWPEDPRGPRGVRTGALTPIATLSWSYDPNTPAWFDRVYRSERTGVIWVQRRDLMAEPESVSWGRVDASRAFEALLSALLTRDASPEPVAAPAEEPPPAEESADPAGLDGSSFGWGAGLAGLLAAGLALVVRWRRQPSVTASRNARVSSAASS